MADFNDVLLNTAGTTAATDEATDPGENLATAGATMAWSDDPGSGGVEIYIEISNDGTNWDKFRSITVPSGEAAGSRGVMLPPARYIRGGRGTSTNSITVTIRVVGKY